MLIILLMKLRTCLNSLLILYSVQTREKCTNVLIFCLGAYSIFCSIFYFGPRREEGCIGRAQMPFLFGFELGQQKMIRVMLSL